MYVVNKWSVFRWLLWSGQTLNAFRADKKAEPNENLISVVLEWDGRVLLPYGWHSWLFGVAVPRSAKAEDRERAEHLICEVARKWFAAYDVRQARLYSGTG